jgi:hypothetical protein
MTGSTSPGGGMPPETPHVRGESLLQRKESPSAVLIPLAGAEPRDGTSGAGCVVGGGRYRSAARPGSPAIRLAWLHLRSRRAPAALAALLACGAALGAALRYHWWLGAGAAAGELPMILAGCAAGIIAVTTYSPFGDPERAAGRRLPLLRVLLTLALCGAAIGFFALGAAAAQHAQAGARLAGGMLPVARNVLGMTGIGLACGRVTGALVGWAGPLAFTALSQFALLANYSGPLTWPARPPDDWGGWVAALAAFAVGLAALAGYPASRPALRR